MPISQKLTSGFWGILFWVSVPLFAAPHALIVIGSTGSSSIAQDLQQTAQTIQKALVQRGFSPDAIHLLSAQSGAPKITRDAVLAGLKDAQGLAPADEFWLVLLGFSAASGDGQPAFQVAGPRLQASDLKTALDAIPARQFVFIGTSDSGGFIPALLNGKREVLAATDAEGEIDLPRFPQSWAEALAANPNAAWKEIAAAAADLTTKTYTQGGLALGEHARLGDPVTGQILAAPFGVTSTAPASESAAPADDSMALINADDIKVVIHQPNSEWEPQPATEETKRLMAEAAKAPNPDGFNAVMLEQRIGYRIGDDRTSENTVLQRIYIAREDGVARWANYELPQDPPAVTTKVIAARLIQPDGSATVFNPTKLPDATDTSSGLCGALTTVFIPGAHAGCLVEIAYRTRRLLDAGDPNYSEELPVQQDVPVLMTQLQLQIPTGSHVHFNLRNLDAKPTESNADGMRTLSWKLPNLPAFEPLPFDPPEHDLLATLDVSSLDSWDEFATWYRRLARGSDEQDNSVKAMAKELAATAKTRIDKIHKAYDFVSSLRYVAIEFGINGIRPRTPTIVLQNRYGDCKDKANLLIALLKDMGIDGRFCLLNRGSSTDTNFPSWQFNHAIAYVPKAAQDGQPDDLWLDTTDSTAPFPTLSPGDVGRAGLVFSGDSAQFLTVTAPGEGVTNLQEDWKFERKPDGIWAGALQDTWTGLAEYEVRSRMRGLSPRQRDFILQTELAKRLDHADFSGLSLTPADDLSVPLKMESQVSSTSIPYPLPEFDVNAYFAPPQRNRPLLINNGQKMHLVQNVAFSSSSSGGSDREDAAPFDQQVAGIHATVLWKGSTSDGTRLRTAELSIDQPLVAQADYPAVRRLLRDWTNHLTP